MTAPLHTIPIPPGPDGETLKRFLSGAVAVAYRQGLVEDHCTAHDRLVRRLEIWPDGRVLLLPE